MHSIHYRNLPLAVRQSIPKPKYSSDRHDPNTKPDHCLASRWDEISQMFDCPFDRIAVHHYQHFLNFTAVANTPENAQDYGVLLTNFKTYAAKDTISFLAIDSTNSRVLYCDTNSDSPRLRPISLSSPFSFETWVTLVFLLIFCAIASSFAIYDIRSVANKCTTINFIKTILNSFVELIICLLEKDVCKSNWVKAFIGLIVICLGNTYKNYLTIELVYPRASDAIQNFTELLELNFNLIQFVSVKDIGRDKSAWLKFLNFHLEIDETKRAKYISEVERWWKHKPYQEKNIINELASVTTKYALIISTPYFMQVYYLNLINDRNYPFSCHFVKRPFAHIFIEFYFLNAKAEDFKWLTAKFLDHGLFKFWKRLESHSLTLDQHKLSLENRSKRYNSSSAEGLDAQNFIGQVHLVVFYIVIAILTAICVAIFLLEYAMQSAQALSLFVLNKSKHFCLQLLWTIVRFLSLMRRQIGRLCQNPNRSKITLDRSRIDYMSDNQIHKIEVKPEQQ
jgi:hypothetical protein